jgi:hypothetical protein
VLVNVHDKPPVPVVICDGSGRAADLLAFTHKYAYTSPTTKRVTMDIDVQEQLITTIMKTFAYTKAQANYLFIQLMNCVINKDLISILEDHAKDLGLDVNTSVRIHSGSLTVSGSLFVSGGNVVLQSGSAFVGDLV